jgi:hypothetical protein
VRTQHNIVVKAVVTVAVAAGLVVGGGAAAQAAPFVFCATGKAGNAGVVSCAANGTAYTFQAKVVCQSTIDAAVTREIYGPVTQPGSSSSATCASTETVASVASVVL